MANKAKKYVVAGGKAVCSKRGVLGVGVEVSTKDFAGKDTVQKLVKKGVLKEVQTVPATATDETGTKAKAEPAEPVGKADDKADGGVTTADVSVETDTDTGSDSEETEPKAKA